MNLDVIPPQNIVPASNGGRVVSIPEAFQLAIEAQQKGDFQRAMELYSAIVRANPNAFNAWNNLGAIFLDQKKTHSALICFKKAYEKNPESIMHGTNVANALIALGRGSEAQLLCEQMLEQHNNNPEIFPAYNNALREDMQFAKAIEVLDIAKEHKPTDPFLDWGRGQNLLSIGRFDEGFLAYESRYHLGTGKVPTKDFGCPRWLGLMDKTEIDLTGKIILLHEEQGFGDTIMAARYIPWVKQKVGQSGIVILQCKPHLIRLFKEVGADFVIGLNQVPGTNNIPKPDYHTLVMSLPGAFGTQPTTIPPPAKLHIPDEARKKFAFIGNQYPKDKFPNIKKIGIVWYGSDSFSHNDRRSIGLDAFLPFAERSDIKFYSLQKEPYSKQLYDQGANVYIEDMGQHCVDFADTAAVIEQLDFIVMSDSSVAHLAGTMGKRVVNIITESPYWIYTLNKRKTAWYPGMELIRKNELHKVFKKL